MAHAGRTRTALRAGTHSYTCTCEASVMRWVGERALALDGRDPPLRVEIEGCEQLRVCHPLRGGPTGKQLQPIDPDHSLGIRRVPPPRCSKPDGSNVVPPKRFASPAEFGKRENELFPARPVEGKMAGIVV